ICTLKILAGEPVGTPASRNQPFGDPWTPLPPPLALPPPLPPPLPVGTQFCTWRSTELAGAADGTDRADWPGGSSTLIPTKSAGAMTGAGSGLTVPLTGRAAAAVANRPTASVTPRATRVNRASGIVFT